MSMRLTARGSGNGTDHDPVALVLSCLDKVKARGDGKWMARCPAHDDRTPSLSVSRGGDGRALLHCFAGCAFRDVLAAIGMEEREAFVGQLDGPWLSQSAQAEVSLAATMTKIAQMDAENGRDVDWAGYQVARRKLAEKGIDPGPDISLDVGIYPVPPSAADFLALEFPPIVGLLGPFATQQLALVYAPPGLGKTMFAMSLAYAMAEGREFLGWPSGPPVRVLYVDGEMAADMMQARLAQAPSERLYVANLLGWGIDMEALNLADEGGQKVVTYWADKLAADVIVIDNLMSLAWVDGVSMNSDEAWQPVRRWCIEQRKAGRSVLIVDHSNALGQIFGTKTKLWHVDLAIRLSPVEEPENDDLGTFDETVPSTKNQRLRLSHDKVRSRYTWDSSSSGTEYQEIIVTLGDVGTDWHAVPAGVELKRIARDMKENGMSIREIAEELGISKSKVGRYVKK